MLTATALLDPPAQTWADLVRNRLRGCTPEPGTRITLSLPGRRAGERVTIEGTVETIHHDGFVVRGRYSVFVAWVDLYRTEDPVRIAEPGRVRAALQAVVDELHFVKRQARTA